MKKTILTMLIIVIVSSLTTHAQNLSGTIVYSRATPPYGNIWMNNGFGMDSLLLLNGHAPKVSTNGVHMLYMKTSAPLWYAGQLARRNMITQTDTAWYNGDWIVGYDFFDADSSLIYSYACGIYHATFNNVAINTVLQTGCSDDGPDLRQSDSLIVFHNIGQSLRLIKLDGSNLTSIPNSVSFDVWPVWSNDGQWIAFGKTNANYSIVENIYKIEPGGTNRTQLTFFTPNDSASLAAGCGWNDDNTVVIFGGRVAGKTSLFAVKADGSGIVDTIYTAPGDDINFVSVGGNINYNVGVSEINNPYSFSIYPNPVVTDFTVKYSSALPAVINISLKDISGRTVGMLMNRKINPGSHEFKLILPGNITAGIYFLHLSSTDFSLMRKLIVIK